MKPLANALLSLVYPPDCLACGAALDPAAGDHFCAACLEELTACEHGRCPKCAAALPPGVLPGKRCPMCRDAFRHIRGTACVGDFQGKLMELVHAFKYSRRRFLGRSLSELLAQATVAAPWRREVDVVIPVPLDLRKFLRRGFNQAEILARTTASALSARRAPKILKRVPGGPPQVELKRRQRFENVKGRFKVRRPARVRGRCVLLVDDVATTGATLEECARVLRSAGARRVYAAVLARTSGRTSDLPAPAVKAADRS